MVAKAARQIIADFVEEPVTQRDKFQGDRWQVDELGWLTGVDRVLVSPNQNARPAEEQPSLLVVHGISLPPGEFGGPWIDQLFTNQLAPQGHPYFAKLQGLEVSSHFLIRRDGELVQYVACSQRAWHAGKSVWAGRENCNDFSIGIELEGTDDIPYEDVQYQVLTHLVRVLQVHYGIGCAAVVGHEHVAPGRKTDPGPAFDWQRLRAGLLNDVDPN